MKLLLLVALTALAQDAAEVRIRVAVPERLAKSAEEPETSNRPAPVLALEGVRIGANEGIKLRVIGDSEPRPTLGVASTVGHKQHIPAEPIQKLNLVVPLNKKAWPLIAGRKEITLILQLDNAGGRPPLEFDKAILR